MSTNPFESPSIPPPGQFPPAPHGPQPAEFLKDDLQRVPWTMNYMGAFEMIQRRPDWLSNAFLAGVCLFIPFVGGLVLIGYSFECAETLNRTRGSFYPKFDFNRFMDYLMRGLGPFLVQMMMAVVQVPLFIFCYVAMVMGMLGAAAAGEGGNGGAAAGVAIAVLVAVFFVVFAVSILMYFVYLPLALRGGMANDVNQSFQFGWGMAFIKKMWKEMLYAWLFQMGVSIPITLIGLLTCYIGLLPGITYMLLIQAWLSFQLYRVFLARGGDPIPFKPLPYPLPTA